MNDFILLVKINYISYLVCAGIDNFEVIYLGFLLVGLLYIMLLLFIFMLCYSVNLLYVSFILLLFYSYLGLSVDVNLCLLLYVEWT